MIRNSNRNVAAKILCKYSQRSRHLGTALITIEFLALKSESCSLLSKR